MAEIIFILTTVFVAYVIYAVIDCEKALKAKKTAVSPAPVKKQQASPAPVKKAPAPTKKTPAPTNSLKDLPETLKNPETGESVKVANNYRFIKRWIKEALVSEGLLDKIYKNNELDDAASKKIDAALIKLKGMKKYQ